MSTPYKRKYQKVVRMSPLRQEMWKTEIETLELYETLFFELYKEHSDVRYKVAPEPRGRLHCMGPEIIEGMLT